MTGGQAEERKEKAPHMVELLQTGGDADKVTAFLARKSVFKY